MIGNCLSYVCGRGHQYTPENTLIRRKRNGTTYRQCRQCNALIKREQRARTPEPLTPIRVCFNCGRQGSGSQGFIVTDDGWRCRGLSRCAKELQAVAA